MNGSSLSGPLLQVAVKVQYPGLRGAANADLTTLSMLSAAAAALFPDFKLSWLYDELRLKLTEELGKLCIVSFDVSFPCFVVMFHGTCPG
jgi:hypothetical protein